MSGTDSHTANETPRTDAEHMRLLALDYGGGVNAWEVAFLLMRDFARQLERELSEARRTAEFWKANHIEGNRVIDALQSAASETRRTYEDGLEDAATICDEKAALSSVQMFVAAMRLASTAIRNLKMAKEGKEP